CFFFFDNRCHKIYRVECGKVCKNRGNYQVIDVNDNTLYNIDGQSRERVYEFVDTLGFTRVIIIKDEDVVEVPIVGKFICTSKYSDFKVKGCKGCITLDVSCVENFCSKSLIYYSCKKVC